MRAAARLAATCSALLLVPAPAATAAQGIAASARGPGPAPPAAPSALGVAKWAALGAAIAASGFGYAAHLEASRRHEQIERVCREAPPRCAETTAEGGPADRELSALWGEARSRDRRARRLLLAGQLGLVASVALFILDLRQGDASPTIPYEPRRWRMGPGREGGAELRLTLPARLPRGSPR